MLRDQAPVQPVAQVLVADESGDVLQPAVDLEPGDEVVVAELVAEVEGRSSANVGPELTRAGDERRLADIGERELRPVALDRELGVGRQAGARL